MPSWSARSKRSLRRLNNFGRRSATNGSCQTSNPWPRCHRAEAPPRLPRERRTPQPAEQRRHPTRPQLQGIGVAEVAGPVAAVPEAHRRGPELEHPGRLDHLRGGLARRVVYEELRAHWGGRSSHRAQRGGAGFPARCHSAIPGLTTKRTHLSATRSTLTVHASRFLRIARPAYRTGQTYCSCGYVAADPLIHLRRRFDVRWSPLALQRSGDRTWQTVHMQGTESSRRSQSQNHNHKIHQRSPPEAQAVSESHPLRRRVREDTVRGWLMAEGMPPVSASFAPVQT